MSANTISALSLLWATEFALIGLAFIDMTRIKHLLTITIDPSHEQFPGRQTVLGLLSSGPSLISSTLDNFSAGLKVYFHEYFRICFHPLGISKLNCIKLLSHCFSLIFTHSMARVMLNMIFKVHCELW